MKTSIFSYLLAISLLSPVMVVAANASSDTGSLKQVQNKGVLTLKAAFAKRMPSLKVSKISVTPIAGLYQVVVGNQVVYMDAHAKYMLDGDLINISTRKNYSEQAKSAIRLNAIASLGEKNMQVFKPAKVEHKITVITDVDCPYCRRLHSEIPEYMKNNIEVRYIFLPLKGENDRKKTESVWCAKNQHAALNLAMSGGQVEAKTCKNPLSKQIAAANKIGVRGTPAIILENGQMIPGYVPVKQVVAELHKN